ncbi:MAG: hypothetical protein NTZ32_08800 [Planctomycetales bacterium]|nr:hypothetical protein [Planctomycetales bacterium]
MNALTALPLASLAIVVRRVARRPAWTHVVWVLVLLKFVTPPLLQSPVAIEVPRLRCQPLSWPPMQGTLLPKHCFLRLPLP